MLRPFMVVLALIFLWQPSLSQSIAQFRGPDRNGVFPETELLKSWPDAGPKLLWAREDLDRGFASVAVTDEAIYLAGMDSRVEYLSVLDLNGETLWRIRYGQAVQRTYPDTRCTPTIEGDRIYVIGGRGEVVCINGRERKIQWSVNAFEKFEGEFWQWEIAESVLIVDDTVIYTPGGNVTSMVALDKITWQTKGSVTAADGMLYCYEEKRGNLALVKPTPDDFEIVSSFRITQGSGPHWTQPVVHGGVLFIRHGNALMAYDVRI
ncbi:MAG: PQQ-binding-like beta-propeller repeat protein [Candidatus Aminicenantaceae bacterium]